MTDDLEKYVELASSLSARRNNPKTDHARLTYGWPINDCIAAITELVAMVREARDERDFIAESFRREAKYKAIAEQDAEAAERELAELKNEIHRLAELKRSIEGGTSPGQTRQDEALDRSRPDEPSGPDRRK